MRRAGPSSPGAIDVPAVGRDHHRVRGPLVSRYLEALRETLLRWNTPDADIAEILGEIDNHIAEGEQAGRTLSSILGGLGRPDRLAEAYGGALLLDPPGSVAARWRRPLERPLLFAGSALLVAGLAGATLVLAAAALLGLAAGIVLPFAPARLLDPTLRAGLPQVVVLSASALALALAVQLARWFGIVARTAEGAWRRAGRQAGRSASPRTGAGRDRSRHGAASTEVDSEQSARSTASGGSMRTARVFAGPQRIEEIEEDE